MKEQKRIEFWISIFAVIIAAGSFWLSWKIYQKDTTENLLLNVSMYHRNYKTVINRGFGDLYPATIPLRWNLLIANNGAIPVSISKSRLIQVSQDYPIDYSNIGGISLDGENVVEFPINLPPGESRKYIIIASIIISSDIYENLKDKYPIGSVVSHRILRSHLGKKGIDLYGNKLILTEFEGGGVSIEYPANIKESKQQIFKLTIETARKKSNSVSFSEYSQFY